MPTSLSSHHPWKTKHYFARWFPKNVISDKLPEYKYHCPLHVTLALFLCICWYVGLYFHCWNLKPIKTGLIQGCSCVFTHTMIHNRIPVCDWNALTKKQDEQQLRAGSMDATVSHNGKFILKNTADFYILVKWHTVRATLGHVRFHRHNFFFLSGK